MKKDKVANLTPFTSSQDREKARVNGRAGGIASASSRRWKKSVREFLQDFLSKEVPSDLQEKLAQYGIPEKDRTYEAALFIGVFHKAMRDGDVESATAIFQWAGLLPLQQEREAAELANYQGMSGQKEKSRPMRDGDSSFQDVVIYNPTTGEPGNWDRKLVLKD